MKVNFEHCLINEKEFYAKEYQKKVPDIHNQLHSGEVYGTHWVDYPINYDKKELAKVQKLAKEIAKTSSVLLVIGIGGSYLGAKAGINMLPRKSKVEVMFAGINFDYADLGTTLDKIKDKDVTVNVVSKSGSTVEALSTLNIVERFMKNKYKNDYKSRMIFTTSKDKGYLNAYASANGIETLSVPDGMGGRYSVLCSVGALPFVCAGINIKKVLEGAKDAYNELNTPEIENNAAYKYAIYRHLLNKKLGKKMELFASFSYNLTSFGYWLQQLFTESEGKEGKGLFVCPVAYSTDLHSVGQFVQDGSPILAETFIDVKNPTKDNTFSNIALDSPIKFLDGKSMSEVNRAAYEGTVQAHIESKVPIVSIEVDEISEYTFGYLVYFFELSCAMSGYLLGINPFDQPGVESYKAKMKALLKD
ncbi:MAG: glucose-6-phosphate isomerase [Clostridia bacterium]|nr:glucose-6-phosphate isomerase [Clostridia bacterium]